MKPCEGRIEWIRDAPSTDDEKLSQFRANASEAPGILASEGAQMSDKQKPTHTMPGGAQDQNNQADDGVVNDSFGTVDPADTTGTGEENEPCQPRDKSAGQENPHHENSRRN